VVSWYLKRTRAEFGANLNHSLTNLPGAGKLFGVMFLNCDVGSVN